MWVTLKIFGPIRASMHTMTYQGTSFYKASTYYMWHITIKIFRNSGFRENTKYAIIVLGAGHTKLLTRIPHSFAGILTCITLTWLLRDKNKIRTKKFRIFSEMIFMCFSDLFLFRNVNFSKSQIFPEIGL